MSAYLMRIVCLSILYGVCRSILGQQGTADKTLRLVFGILFCFILISPILDPGALNFSMPDISFDAQQVSAQGKDVADDAQRAIIISQTEAYILDKAAALGISLQVQVSLKRGDPPIPEFVILSGNAPMQSRQKLCEILSATLGIAKENIRWEQ